MISRKKIENLDKIMKLKDLFFEDINEIMNKFLNMSILINMSKKLDLEENLERMKKLLEEMDNIPSKYPDIKKWCTEQIITFKALFLQGLKEKKENIKNDAE